MSWEELVKRLFRHACALGARPEEAEDLVHDAIEILRRDPSWYDPQRASLERVLRVVIANRLTDRRRARGTRRRARPHLWLLKPWSGPGPSQSLEGRQAAQRRAEFLEYLNAAERALFWAWIAQQQGDLNGHSAAASLGLQYKEYENRKKKLRRRCQAIVAKMGIDARDLFGTSDEEDSP